MNVSSMSAADIKNINTPTTSSLKIDTSEVGAKSEINEMTDENGRPTKQAYQTAVNKLNQFMEYTQRNSKFVYHEDLEKYYVEIVDAKTKEIIKEIPPKELLDAYYEMQKMIGKVIDKTI